MKEVLKQLSKDKLRNVKGFHTNHVITQSQLIIETCGSSLAWTLDTSQPASLEFLGIFTSISQIISCLMALRFSPCLDLRHISNQHVMNFLGYPLSFHKSFLALSTWVLPSPRPVTHLNQHLTNFLGYPLTFHDRSYHHTINYQHHNK